MKYARDLGPLLVRTIDGFSALVWVFVFGALFVRSIGLSGFHFEQLKFVFFQFIAFLIFIRFRVGDSGLNLKTNYWGVINVNAFGVFMLLIGGL